MPDEWSPFVAEIEGRFVAASNATLLGSTRDGEQVVYKPIQGERPLWDFPSDTLAMREVLTYQVSELLDLGVVPETVLGDGMYGPGSVQRYVDFDDDWDAVPLVNSADTALWPMAVLDVVCNNADRKVGHILKDRSGSIFGIDHGLTFHRDDKLRTVLWGFAGELIPADLQARLRSLHRALAADGGIALQSGLQAGEWQALLQRIDALLASPRHPEPPGDRPPLPWPPY